MNMTQNQEPPRLPGPLSPAPDIASSWQDITHDFDTAAQAIITAHKEDGEARDLPVTDLRAWGVVPLNDRFGLAPLARNHPPRLLRHSAFSSLMTRLGAPTEFVRDRLPAPLQLATANWLLLQQDKPLPGLLRLRGEQIAAIVSERYAPLDPEELLTSVRDALEHQGLLHEVEVKSIATGLVDVVRLIIPAQQKPIKVGDVSALGIDVSSSSFGRSSIHIRAMAWRLVCTNGLRAPDRLGPWFGNSGYSFRHVGDSQRLRDGIADAIPSVIVHAGGLLERWQRSVSIYVEDVAKQIDAMRELTQNEREGLRQSVMQEAGAHQLPEHTDLFTFVNGLTALGHSATPIRRLELETLAGELLFDRTKSG